MESVTNQSFYTISETAEIFGVTVSTIRNWIKCGWLEKENNLITSKNVLKLKGEIRRGRLDKLNKRANKSQKTKTFAPDEYLSGGSTSTFEEILAFIAANKLDLSLAIDYLLLNLLNSAGLVSVNSGAVVCKNKYLKNEPRIANINLNDKSYRPLLDFTIPKERDPAGFVYQSLREVRSKSKSGSYYTPDYVVADMAREYITASSTFLDPCCGAGQFLLSAGEIIQDPSNIYGMDIDPIAVKIAKINLMIKYKNFEFEPNIFCYDSLTKKGVDQSKFFKTCEGKLFDVVASNPPWGYHFSKSDLIRLSSDYPEINSKESFSYFIISGMNYLKAGGALFFILPESFLNVALHRDIRNVIVNNYFIEKITRFGKVFKGVFTSVIGIYLKKKSALNDNVLITGGIESYTIPQKRWRDNWNNVFDIKLDSKDAEIIKNIYDIPHTTLKGRAEWGLGIVTGNNKKYLSDTFREGYEPVYTGKEVRKFYLSEPRKYIKFTPEVFQQVVSESKFRADEKLIYKFISKYLVFSYDNSKALTLNSAKFLIPAKYYPIKVTLALFNSSLYQYIFIKRFASIKVLRSHIEELPLPDFPEKVLRKIENMVDQITSGGKTEVKKELDDYIFDIFNIFPEDKEVILKSI